MRKVYFFLLMVLAIFFIVLFFYTNIDKKQSFTFDLLQAVPEDAYAIIETRNIQQVKTNLTSAFYWNDLKKIKEISRLSQYFSIIDTIGSLDKNSCDLLSKTPIIISFHLIGKDQSDFVVYSVISGISSENKIKNLIEKMKGNNSSINYRMYENTKIYNVVFNGDKSFQNFSFSISDGLFFLSHSPLLVEQVIRRFKNSSSCKIPESLQRVRLTAGKNVDANIYINMMQFPIWFAGLINTKYAQVFKNCSNTPEWIALDMVIKTDGILLDGFSLTELAGGQYLSVFRQQEAVEMQTIKILPDNTTAAFIIGLKDSKKYKKDYEYLLEKNNKYGDYKERIKSLESKYMFDFDKLFYSDETVEYGIIYTNLNDSGIYYSVKSAESKNSFNNIKNSFYPDKNKIENQVKTIKINNQNFDILKIPEPDLMGKYFGNLFSWTPSSYVTCFEDYLVFSSSVENLNALLYQVTSGNRLINEKKFKSLNKYLLPKTNLLFYTNPAANNNFIKKIFNTKNLDINEIQKGLIKSAGFCLQLNAEKNLLYNNIVIHFNNNCETGPQVAWKCLLDTAFMKEPEIVINFNNHEKEIIVQDCRNTIYLIDKNGTIQWKKNILESIIGTIFQIDYFNNKKLQFIFNGKNYIHIIDRNGNYIENFPEKLPVSATNGLTVMNYDNKGEYRFFVACEDKRVYSFTKKIKLIKGWKFCKTEGLVNSPVQYFKNGEKDFLLLGDNKYIYILNRKGEERIKISNQFVKSFHNKFFLEDKSVFSDESFITTDTSGTVKYIFGDGHVEEKKMRHFSQGHYFDYQDIDEDLKKEFIFIEKNQLYVYKLSGKLLFSTTFNGEVSQPVFYSDGTKTLIGVGLQSENEVYVINKEGIIVKGFPIKGNTPFLIEKIDQSDNFNILVGSNDNFLYNYSFQFEE